MFCSGPGPLLHSGLDAEQVGYRNASGQGAKRQNVAARRPDGSNQRLVATLITMLSR
jgi:hypothetical protein